jgi:Type I phosphodiesterase / nucleotide pyrophosphatase
MFEFSSLRRRRATYQMPLLRLFSSLLILSLSVLPSGAFAAPASVPNSCQLNSANGNIQHVIYVIFDNTHFLRDNPNVPSDLEQMPNLLNFLRGNGTMLTNDHTVLISHTANGIVTSFTGVYPDRHGQAVSNSYRYFKADGTTASSTSFKYWTDLVDDVGIPPADPLPNMVNGDSGTPQTMPAPWVPYTRAGCDFGAVASANIVLENTGTGPNGDMTKVFGQGSPEWNEAVASNAAPPNTAARALAQTDFVGLAVHCGAGDGVCASNPNAKPDLLPDEPGGYNGFLGLFGAKYINPLLTGGPVVNDLSGQPIDDPFNQPGFPGFDGLFASTTLAYIAEMQEAGIPVTFGYISDAHDNHGNAGNIHIAYGPGEPGYVAQLQAYDQAFGAFFARLAADGIDKSNTLFVFTNEEGDHFAGSQPSPAGCDGVNTPCSYTTVSEVNGNLTGLLATQQGITTPFTVHADMAPTVYITGNPARTDLVTRNFGRALGQLTAVSPLTGQTDNLTVALADPVGMNALHMITADPQRTPTLVMFAHPDYFFFTGAPNCNSPCIFIPAPSNFTFAWNHGGIQPEIATTWLGMVGPGVRNLGDNTTWADHTDGRPTMLALVGLEDTYIHDGRVLSEILEDAAKPSAVKSSSSFIALAQMYKQINAPFGQFGMDALAASTMAINSGSVSDDNVYTTIEGKIESLTEQRNAIAMKMRALLENAAFNGQTISSNKAQALIKQGQTVLDKMHALATSP